MIRQVLLSFSLSFFASFLAFPAEAQQPKRKAVAAADPLRFDLICTTTFSKTNGTSTDGSAPFNATVGSRTRYRIDLRQMRFCYDACSTINGILTYDADRIVLGDGTRIGRSGNQRNWMRTYFVISRRNGTSRIENSFFQNEFGNEVGQTVEEASCSRAPFSGFPPRKF
jgi:hypothetical protein